MVDKIQYALTLFDSKEILILLGGLDRLSCGDPCRHKSVSAVLVGRETQVSASGAGRNQGELGTSR